MNEQLSNLQAENAALLKQNMENQDKLKQSAMLNMYASNNGMNIDTAAQSLNINPEFIKDVIMDVYKNIRNDSFDNDDNNNNNNQ